MHEIQRNHPTWQAQEAKEADYHSRRTRWQEHCDSILGPWRREREQWRADYAEAARTGGEFPPEPPQPSGVIDLGAQFRDEEAQLRVERRQVMASLRPELEVTAAQIERRLLGDLLDTPPSAWGPLLEELEELRVTVNELRLAAGHATVVQPLAIAEVFVAAWHGASLLNADPARRDRLLVNSDMVARPPAALDRELVEVLVQRIPKGGVEVPQPAAPPEDIARWEAYQQQRRVTWQASRPAGM